MPDKQKEQKSRKRKYQIVLFSNKKQVKYIGAYTTIENANKVFYEMLEKNKKEVFFPIRYLNCQKMIEASYELAILKVDEGENEDNRIQNEIGEYVKTEISEKYDENVKYGKVNKNRYIVYNKEEYLIEETFWVYGYHPRYQRKTAVEIFGMLIMPLEGTRLGFNRILCFNNKLIVENENDFDMVICKNVTDCYRLYNFLEELSKLKKIKSILWFGICRRSSKHMIMNKIMEKTGWNEKKIMRKNTRP